MQHVGQEQRERLVADDLAGAPDRVAEAERRLLPGEARLAGRRLGVRESLQLLCLAALPERALELELQVEMVFDGALAAAGHEDEMLDAGRPRLVDHMLHHGPVDDREHLLRNRLGGGQEAGAEAGDGENGFADALHREPRRRARERSRAVPVPCRRCRLRKRQGRVGQDREHAVKAHHAS